MVDVRRHVQALPHIDGAGALAASSAIPDKLVDLVVNRNRTIHCRKKGGGGPGRFPGLVFGLSAPDFDDLYDLVAAS